jgi:hypothetical protein
MPAPAPEINSAQGIGDVVMTAFLYPAKPGE